MNNLQAYLGLAQLKNIKKLIKNKKKIFLTYSNYFNKNKFFNKIIILKYQNLEGWIFAQK